MPSRARHVDSYLKSESSSLNEFAGSFTPRSLLKMNASGQEDPEEMERMRLWMAGYTEGDGAAVEVLLVDNQGKIILSSMPERNGINVQAAPWFKMSQAQPCIYGPVVAEGRKTPTLTFAAPVFDGKTGQPLGRVAVAQPLSELNEICIDRTGLGATGETYILDRAGYMLTPSRFDTSSAPLSLKVDTFILHIAGASFEQSDAPNGQSNTYTYTNYLGIEVIGAYAPVMQTEWVCVAERAKDEALAALNVLSQATTWIFAILGILAVLFALLLSRSISRPVLALQRGARELKAGNLGYRVDLKRRDELGDLARSFNAMAESLRQSHEQLAQHGRELEETVSLRTTELRQANTRLEELNASLATSNKELQDFAYVASHDLREPLRKISAFGQLLSETLQGRLDADEQENLGFMVDGASRMQAMIDALLTYSRVTTQASPSERVDLNHLLRDLRSLELAARIEETGGSVVTPEPLPVVHGDPLQMRQLFQNLIGNALKFHRDGVRPEVTIVAEPSDDAMVRIGVTDNGIGIAPEHAEQVFAMFKRLHSRSRYERDRNRSRRLQEDS